MAHAITVGFTPLCTSCGGELETGITQADPKRQHGIFDRDNPTERTEQRVFVGACPNCFIYRNNEEALRAALARYA